ncbi:MAG: putative transcription activator [Sphingobacteriales bacterium]|nr:putative transcription activator [Sphingobacteriales bacterium]
MGNYILENDQTLFYLDVETFPEGIRESFDKLNNMVIDKDWRNAYGISYKDDNGKIHYKAAVTQLYEGENEKYCCNSLTIKAGNYVTVTILDWMKRLELIGQTFMQLCETPGIDVSSPCIEWYKNGRN